MIVGVGGQSPVAAQVDTGSGRPEGVGGLALATFEGRTIDLSTDWGEARACLIWHEGGVAECFRSPQALEAREAQLGREKKGGGPPPSDDGAVMTASYSYSCSSPLRLFDYEYYGGRQLSFWDRGYWQNLWWYGFDNRTSSYIVGGCYVYLADYNDGGGWWYPGNTYPYAGEAAMQWGWSNAVSSIYIG